MKKYFTVFFIFIITALSYAQHRGKIIFLDAFRIPTDTNSNCVIPYRIPYANLLFKKSGVGYLSGITLNIKIVSSNNSPIYKSVTKSVFLKKYKQTKSKEDFLNGVIKVHLQKGEYSVETTLLLKYQKSIIKIKKNVLNVTDSLSVLKPLVISSKNRNCNNRHVFNLYEYGKIIPFSPSPKMMLIPVRDTSVSKIKISVFQNQKRIIKDSIINYENRKYDIVECKDKLFVDLSKSNNYKLFLLKNIEKYFDEGKTKVIVSYGEKGLAIFHFKVSWINKPFVLTNTEFSINLIDKIWGKHDVVKIFDLDGEQQYNALKKYLSKYDTDKSTKFNEVMGEFYNRVDYAIFNFGKDISFKNALSDMGKIYIKFGKPDNKKRVFSKKNNIMEIWKYNKPSRKFVFLDKTGLGNYTLIK